MASDGEYAFSSDSDEGSSPSPTISTKKTKKTRRRGRGRPRGSVKENNQNSVKPVLCKRKNEKEPERPSKQQKISHTAGTDVTVAALRQQALAQKRLEKAKEEEIRLRFVKELEFLKAGGNLLDFDPFGENHVVQSTAIIPLVKDEPISESETETAPVIKEPPPEPPVFEPVKIEPLKEEKEIIIEEKKEEKRPKVKKEEKKVVIEEKRPRPRIIIKNSEDTSSLPAVLNGKSHSNDQLAINQAHYDAKVLLNVSELQKLDLWASKRLPRIPDPVREKTHWDYLLAEMIWMANDFKQEKKMKHSQGKLICRGIAKKRQQDLLKQKRAEKEDQYNIVKIAANISKSVKEFWSKIEQLVKYKHETRLEEKMLEAREKQIDFLVGQTERYSSKLATDLTSPRKPAKPIPLNMDSSDNKEGMIESPADINNRHPADGKATPMDTSDPDSQQMDEMDADVDKNERKEIITKAAEFATKHQPTGTTLSTTSIKTNVPFLLKGTLREYQHIGLDWMVSMYEAKLNGILADEMGLGKTIMTISLLAHLACDRGIWGPHLIVVPTSVMLNWEREFKRWCPALKILTYYGSQKERKLKRHGWSKPNAFHVCITSYNLIAQDKMMLSRKKWIYLILDEAQNIKNFKSQKWQVLLNFNTKRRLLLTGTPLQNNLMELWSLMHFLMPHIFQSHADFKDWFCNPVNSMIEGTTSINEQLIARLHGVLRPFILRRLKKDVEKQLPNKYEHIVPCQLSKRQRFLYDEFMSSTSTKEQLASGNYLTIINILMQLRKVCNHPDLFEVRSIASSFQQHFSLSYWSAPYLFLHLSTKNFDQLNLKLHNFDFIHNENTLNAIDYMNILRLKASNESILDLLRPPVLDGDSNKDPFLIYKHNQLTRQYNQQKSLLENFCYVNNLRCNNKPLFGYSLLHLLNFTLNFLSHIHLLANDPRKYFHYPNLLLSAVKSREQRLEYQLPIISRFNCYIPTVVAQTPQLSCNRILFPIHQMDEVEFLLKPVRTLIHPIVLSKQLLFPEKRLIQFDCGKLQKLAILLRRLKAENHRVLIFTQMTRMLDILEIFLNLYGYAYLRLDGATKPEQRQAQMEHFNADNRIFAFILSTRSGGFGINLIGADTVVFYDSDWNPAMDAQAQDRCHRIGQTREVHIYRLISEKTIEENILKKANQKRLLDTVAIEGGKFTTDFFQKVDITSLVDDDSAALPIRIQSISKEQLQRAMAEAEDETDVEAMKEAQKEIDADIEEFEDTTTTATAENPEVEDMDPTEMIKSKLTSIQKYAYRFLEEVTPVVDTEEMNAIEEMVVKQEKRWEQDTLKRIAEKENTDEVHEVLYYEITHTVSSIDACKEYLSEGMLLYGPPEPPPDTIDFDNPAHCEHIYIHPFDYDPIRVTDITFDDFLPSMDSVYNTNPKSESFEKSKLERSEASQKEKASKNSESSVLRKKASEQGLFTARYKKSSSTQSSVITRKRPRTDDVKQNFPWTSHENQLITQTVASLGVNWDLIADLLNTNNTNSSKFHIRTPSQCNYHYNSMLSPKKPNRVQKSQNLLTPAPAVEKSPLSIENELQAQKAQFNRQASSLLSILNRYYQDKQSAFTRSESATNVNPPKIVANSNQSRSPNDIVASRVKISNFRSTPELRQFPQTRTLIFDRPLSSRFSLQNLTPNASVKGRTLPSKASNSQLLPPRSNQTVPPSIPNTSSLQSRMSTTFSTRPNEFNNVNFIKSTSQPPTIPQQSPGFAHVQYTPPTARSSSNPQPTSQAPSPVSPAQPPPFRPQR